MTPDDVRDLPVMVDVVTAGRAFGIGRDAVYRLIRRNAFPVPVVTLGRRLAVTRASLLDRLGLDDRSGACREEGDTHRGTPR